MHSGNVAVRGAMRGFSGDSCRCLHPLARKASHGTVFGVFTYVGRFKNRPFSFPRHRAEFVAFFCRQFVCRLCDKKDTSFRGVCRGKNFAVRIFLHLAAYEQAQRALRCKCELPHLAFRCGAERFSSRVTTTKKDTSFRGVCRGDPWENRTPVSALRAA